MAFKLVSNIYEGADTTFYDNVALQNMQSKEVREKINSRWGLIDLIHPVTLRL